MSSNRYYVNDLPEFYQDVKIGDILEFPRGLYSHFGVYVGNYRGRDYGVVHFNAPHAHGEKDVNFLNISMSSSSTIDSPDKPKKNVLVVDEIKDIISGKDQYVIINNSKDNEWEPFEADEIIKRVGLCLDKPDEYGAYNLKSNNCEQFVFWLRYGVRYSGQVETVESVCLCLVSGAVAGLSYYAGKSLTSKKEKKKEFP